MRKDESSTAPSRRWWTGTLTVMFTATFASMLTACGTPMQPLPDKLPLPANLTNPCPDLAPLSDGSGASVLRKVIEVSEQYYDCQRKHRALVDAVK